MSEALRIEFDRPNRTYEAGEIVRGRVLLETNRGDRCKSVHLRRYWKAHGKGNKDGDPPETFLLHSGPLVGRDLHEFPFEFATPPGPFSYHGHFFSVDHFAEVLVDIPWARDPKQAEAFILVPGPKGPPPLPALVQATRKAVGGSGQGIRIAAGWGVTLLGIVTLPLGFFLILVGLLLLFPLFKRQVARSKLGNVRASVEAGTAAPGQKLEVKLGVLPKTPVEINSASVEVRAREIVVSGSGKNRSVRKHLAFSEVRPLSGFGEIGGRAETVMRTQVTLPEGAPYSFAAINNKLLWEVVVHVDLPAWPDWKRVFPLVVWPAGAQGSPEPVLEPGDLRAFPYPVEVALDLPRPTGEAPSPPGLAELASGLSELRDRRRAPEEPTPMEVFAPEPVADETGWSEPERVEKVPDESVAVDNFPVGEASSDLADSVEAILAEDMFRGDRERLARELIGKPCAFLMEVAKVERTFALFSDPDYRSGRTIQGTITGTEIVVSAWFPESSNADVDRLVPGSEIRVQGTVAEWDRLRLSPRIRAVME